MDRRRGTVGGFINTSVAQVREAYEIRNAENAINGLGASINGLGQLRKRSSERLQ